MEKSHIKSFYVINQQIVDQYNHCRELTKSTPTFTVSSLKNSSSSDLSDQHLLKLRKMGHQLIHYLSSDATEPENFKPLHLHQ